MWYCAQFVHLLIKASTYALTVAMFYVTSLSEPYDYPSWCLILVFSVHASGAAIFIFEWLSPSGLDRGNKPIRGKLEVNLDYSNSVCPHDTNTSGLIYYCHMMVVCRWDQQSVRRECCVLYSPPPPL